MVKVGIAIGIGVGAFLLLCCVWWGACKLRQCIKTGRISATLEEIVVDRQKGVKKGVVRTFPIVETSELNFDEDSKLQCPICWLQFRDTDTIRQLPHCDHVFHRHCIDPVLEKQITCPVCGTILTDNPKRSEEILNKNNKHPPYQQQIPLRSLYTTSPPSSPKAESPPPPSWVLVNRPVPLPRNALENDSSSSDRFEIELNASQSYGGSGESPLLLKYFNGSHDAEEWPSDDIELDQNCIDISFTFGTEIPVEKRQPGNPNSANEKAVDSFSFSTDHGALPPEAKREMTSDGILGFRSLRRSRGKESNSFSDSNASTQFSRSTSRSSRSTNSSSDSRFDKFERWEYAQQHLVEVAEGNTSDHLPLTKPPNQCSFDVLPVITGSGSFASRHSPGNSPRVAANRKAYSQL